MVVDLSGDESFEASHDGRCRRRRSNSVVSAATAIDAERAEGRSIHDDTIAHLSPARFEKINPYGQYQFDITKVTERQRHLLDDA